MAKTNTPLFLCKIALGQLLRDIPGLESAQIVLGWRELNQGPPSVLATPRTPQALQNLLLQGLRASQQTATHVAEVAGQPLEQVLGEAKALLTALPAVDGGMVDRWCQFMNETPLRSPPHEPQEPETPAAAEVPAPGNGDGPGPAGPAGAAQRPDPA